jgi:CheY-like chemotaxis protein
MHPKRILVVDDEPLVCQSVKMMLACDHHWAETASNGEEALAVFDSRNFDVVFTDFNMPGMKGDQVAQAIRQRDKAKPIVLLTAFPPMNQPIEVDLVVLKPFSLENLREALARVVAEENS